MPDPLAISLGGIAGNLGCIKGSLPADHSLILHPALK